MKSMKEVLAPTSASNYAILVKSYLENFVMKILWCIEKPQERMKVTEKCYENLKRSTWRRVGQELNQILLKGFNNER